jgi:hypothetical protein
MGVDARLGYADPPRLANACPAPTTRPAMAPPITAANGLSMRPTITLAGNPTS